MSEFRQIDAQQNRWIVSNIKESIQQDGGVQCDDV